MFLIRLLLLHGRSARHYRPAEHVSYTNGDPLGNAGSYRKVLEYLYQCAINSLPPSEVVEWICNIYMTHQTDEEYRVFHDRINILATAFNDLKNLGKLKNSVTMNNIK